MGLCLPRWKEPKADNADEALVIPLMGVKLLKCRHKHQSWHVERKNIRGEELSRLPTISPALP